MADALPVEVLKERQHRVGARCQSWPAASDNERTPGELSLTGGSHLTRLAGQATQRWNLDGPDVEGSNLTHLAVRLTQGWDHSVWGRVERLLASEPEDREAEPRPAAKPRQHQTHLTPEQVVSLVADYAAGTSITELTRRYNIRYETAARWLTLNDVTLRPRRLCITPAAIPDITMFRQAGWSWAKIGNKYDCTGSAVRKAYVKLSARTADPATDA